MHKKNKQGARSPDKATAPTDAPKTKTNPVTNETTMSSKAIKAQEEADKKLAALKLKTHKITSALQWYNNLLDELNVKAKSTLVDVDDGEEKKSEDGVAEDTVSGSGILDKMPRRVLTSEQVVEALESLQTSDGDDSEELLADVETKIDLFEWDGMSEWTIDITEQAHKWFRRHIRKDRALCERIIRRLTLLSTGRWPCKTASLLF